MALGARNLTWLYQGSIPTGYTRGKSMSLSYACSRRFLYSLDAVPSSTAHAVPEVRNILIPYSPLLLLNHLHSNRDLLATTLVINLSPSR